MPFFAFSWKERFCFSTGPTHPSPSNHTITIFALFMREEEVILQFCVSTGERGGAHAPVIPIQVFTLKKKEREFAYVCSLLVIFIFIFFPTLRKVTRREGERKKEGRGYCLSVWESFLI